MGTAACRVKLLMSESVELEAVSVTVRPMSDCFSQLSVKVTPFFSYTCTVGAMENRNKKSHYFKTNSEQKKKNANKSTQKEIKGDYLMA